MPKALWEPRAGVVFNGRVFPSGARPVSTFLNARPAARDGPDTHRPGREVSCGETSVSRTTWLD